MENGKQGIEPSCSGKHEAAVALSSVSDEGAVEKLRSALIDADEDVRDSTLISLKYMTKAGQ